MNAAFMLAISSTGCVASSAAQPTMNAPTSFHERQADDPPKSEAPGEKPAAEWVIESAPATPRPPFEFNADDAAFLDTVQKATFEFLWNACDPDTGMVVDRTSVEFASVAGVGFQLASIPAAIERGWISKDAGRERALRVLKALQASPDNRKHGMFYHFLTGPTAKPVDMDVVSTIDSAILFAGMLVAGSYFGGEIDAIATQLVDEADWSKFVLERPSVHEPFLKGFISLGWKPIDPKKPVGEGRILKYAWADAGDEQRLIYAVAQMSNVPKHRVDPALYYRLRRVLGWYPGCEVHSWFPWSGALFTNVFAHLFIDYRSMGPDVPSAQGADRRARIDWWENSRRAVNFHRARALELQGKVPTLGPDAWGLTANDAAEGYQVPSIYPRPVRFSDQVPDIDVANYTPTDKLGGGNVAPYGAGMAIMFEPAASVRALKHMHGLKGPDGLPLVWREPGKPGVNYGFRDSFNLGTGWVAPDNVAIDQGPLFLAIENARTGLIWRLFHAHPRVQAGMNRLGLQLNVQSKP
jgi:hypothetical protein